jgi:hypothetical protein
MNVSGFEKKKSPLEELETLHALQEVLSKDELRVIMAYRRLEPMSTMKVTMRQNGKTVNIVLTHEEIVPLDGGEE